MEENLCSWTPSLVVELIKTLAWPITVLVIGVRFRTGISGSLIKFFSKNTVSEVSASTSGVSAKFIAAQQSLETIEGLGRNAVNLPENMSLEAIRQRHKEHKTEFSENLYAGIQSHIAAFNISSEEIVELLSKEMSLIQSAIRYFDINKVLFRSQFNLFSIMANNGGLISRADAEHNFLSVKDLVGEALLDWDWVKYVAYPVSNGLMIEEGSECKLTPLGRSYVAFMSRNPQLVDELTKF
ncbi:hypothetical protein [Aeromonas salmonicida]|uniref:hypothetical protein n=1 Tax=Aeromonas salmonicida TaxID=645 RepID=UPI003D202B6B